MKRKVVSVVLALTMVAGMAVGCGSSKPAETTTTDDAAAEETTDAAEETDAADTADAAAEAVDGDLADKKVGVCIYQFSDNFMTLFRTELQSYLESKGFKAENIKIVDGANDQATPVSYTHLSSLSRISRPNSPRNSSNSCSGVNPLSR